jgi:heat shock protein HslJ
MSCSIGISTWCLARVALAMLFGLIGHTAMAQSVQGTATYRERIALPPGAVFEATLEDVSRADAARSIIATTRIAKPGNPVYLGVRPGENRRRQPVCRSGENPASPGLAGTSWQLVKFQGSDEKVLTPDDGAKYTIEFAAAGQLTARIDCNRGRGTWKSGGPTQLQLGPLALTRAKCPAGSLHDQIVKQWANIRSYVVKDAHLFLSLMADGGIYEFEPLEKTN